MGKVNASKAKTKKVKRNIKYTSRDIDAANALVSLSLPNAAIISSDSIDTVSTITPGEPNGGSRNPRKGRKSRKGRKGRKGRKSRK
jgi:hypothetical protein